MSTAVDLKTKEEKDAELDRRIEALRKKNEALVKRYQEIEEDKKKAEQEGIAVTTARKPRPHDGEPDRRRTDKENFTVTVDLSRPAGDKRSVMNDWKSTGPPRGRRTSEEGDGSPPRRAGSGRLGRGGQRGGGARQERREPRPDRGEPRPERPYKEGETGEGPGMGRRGGRRGGRGGREGGGREGGGREGGGREAGSGGDRKSKEWEEKRRQNIEQMNEEMEKIAEYERGQRGDGDRPIRNFLDDPRRSGPVPDIDRKEGSRRHVRNWGGLDFENVKTGAEMEKEWSSRRPGPKGTDMTMSMTGRERAEYLRWKKEREQIDEERLARHRNATGQWKREWDAQKTDTMFKEDPALASEGNTPDQEGRRDDSKRPPKAPTFGDFLGQGRGREGGRGERARGRGQSKSYSMHDNRWEGEREDEEKEKSDKPKREERTKVGKKTRGSTSQKVGEKSGAGEEDEDEWEDASDGEDEEEEISGDDDSEEEGRKDRESQKEKTTRKKTQTANPRQQRTPRPKVHIPPPQAAQDSPEGAKPLSPFTPLEGHQPVSDWGEEMEMVSPRSSLGESPLKPPSAESSPPQVQSRPPQAQSSPPQAQSSPPQAQSSPPQAEPLEKQASSVEKADVQRVVVSEPAPEDTPALKTSAPTQPASSPPQAPETEAPSSSPPASPSPAPGLPPQGNCVTLALFTAWDVTGCLRKRQF
ncbi:LOW QUALITY PROTEIN: coiled-coil domain-containing protein 9 [Hypomesus transpacificus]|uniref:LOW QUALITY PROTEIN: coiled-coil domain-containing protein 9 n=1 Tax=Hypomesus transpacificus TaxID=137520 RepID=UPI001F079B9B|nr:LOW QUALITY PROTEIN: coiled-coil domain-containing protein 9 [Hypomesus transpacificus]